MAAFEVTTEEDLSLAHGNIIKYLFAGRQMIHFQAHHFNEENSTRTVI